MNAPRPFPFASTFDPYGYSQGGDYQRRTQKLTLLILTAWFFSLTILLSFAALYPNVSQEKGASSGLALERGRQTRNESWPTLLNSAPQSGSYPYEALAQNCIHIYVSRFVKTINRRGTTRHTYDHKLAQPSTTPMTRILDSIPSRQILTQE